MDLNERPYFSIILYLRKLSLELFEIVINYKSSETTNCLYLYTVFLPREPEN